MVRTVTEAMTHLAPNFNAKWEIGYGGAPRHTDDWSAISILVQEGVLTLDRHTNTRDFDMYEYRDKDLDRRVYKVTAPWRALLKPPTKTSEE